MFNLSSGLKCMASAILIKIYIYIYICIYIYRQTGLVDQGMWIGIRYLWKPTLNLPPWKILLIILSLDKCRLPSRVHHLTRMPGWKFITYKAEVTVSLNRSWLYYTISWAEMEKWEQLDSTYFFFFKCVYNILTVAHK